MIAGATVLLNGNTRVTVHPFGGRVVQVELRDEAGLWTPVLLAPNDSVGLFDRPLDWGCYPLAPWPGRVDHSRFTWQAKTHDLPANDGAHSIHGRGVYLPWAIAEADSNSCIMQREIGEAHGWPFPGQLRHMVSVQDAGLTLTLAVQNLGGEAFPAGLGWHPWFRWDIRWGAGPRAALAAKQHYLLRGDRVPSGEARPPAGAANLSLNPPLAGTNLDDCYGGIEDPIEISWGDLTLSMTSGENCRHAVVFTKSPRGFCVEPQTCSTDAFNLATRGVPGTGLAIVEPGETFAAETIWKWRIAD
jgi:aldose 1-epimerase